MNPVILNYSQCLRNEAHWGYDKIHNVCNQTFTTVNWGSMDWTVAVFFTAMFAGIAAIGVSMVVAMVEAERANKRMMEKFAF